MDDRELALIAAFRLHEVAGRLGVLSRVARSPELREILRELAEQLAAHERSMSTFAQAVPAEDRRGERESRRIGSDQS